MVDGRRFMHPSRRLECTQMVYGGRDVDFAQFQALAAADEPEPRPYKLLWGEIHGHTELSDGSGSLDDYFEAARDVAQLDFCAPADHDHGGVGRPELWGEKWELTQQKVAEYHEPGRFVTLLGYERDSWPWYSNLCLYYREGTGETVRGRQDGEITRGELAALLARDDILTIPHHTSDTGQGANFDRIPPELMTPLMEVYSKWGTGEYFGNPRPVRRESRGGHWRVALESGARMGCVAGSDVHGPYPGLDHRAGGNLRYEEPGIVAVLAEDFTREAIYDALRARRCYGASGTRAAIDFRLNDAVMGEEITLPVDEPRRIHLKVQAQAALTTVAIVKNGRDEWVDHADGEGDSMSLIVHDFEAQRETDYYYIRVTQIDGRQAWSSPIWVTTPS